MVEIKGEALIRIASLFDGWEETLVWSCLQGQMGRAFADNASHPRSARIELADFCYLAGEPDRELTFLPQGKAHFCPGFRALGAGAAGGASRPLPAKLALCP